MELQLVLNLVKIRKLTDFKNGTETVEEEEKPRIDGIPRVEIVLPKIVSPIENKQIPLNPPSGTKYFGGTIE